VIAKYILLEQHITKYIKLLN